MWCGGVRAPPLCAERGAVQNRRADRVVRPYGSATRSAEQVLAGGVEPRPYGWVARSAEEESPRHGFAVPAPFRQGGRGDGDADCHNQ